MFHKAINLEFREGTSLEVTFQNGEVKAYDMATLFTKYPQLEALKDRQLFLSGKLMGYYGIVWNDELDIEAETIYEDGVTVRMADIPINYHVAQAGASDGNGAGNYFSMNPMYCFVTAWRYIVGWLTAPLML